MGVLRHVGALGHSERRVVVAFSDMGWGAGGTFLRSLLERDPTIGRSLVILNLICNSQLAEKKKISHRRNYEKGSRRGPGSGSVCSWLQALRRFRRWHPPCGVIRGPASADHNKTKFGVWGL